VERVTTVSDGNRETYPGVETKSTKVLALSAISRILYRLPELEGSPHSASFGAGLFSN
jgi:hypothetical protein